MFMFIWLMLAVSLFAFYKIGYYQGSKTTLDLYDKIIDQQLEAKWEALQACKKAVQNRQEDKDAN